MLAHLNVVVDVGEVPDGLGGVNPSVVAVVEGIIAQQRWPVYTLVGWSIRQQGPPINETGENSSKRSDCYEDR